MQRLMRMFTMVALCVAGGCGADASDGAPDNAGDKPEDMMGTANGDGDSANGDDDADGGPAASDGDFADCNPDEQPVPPGYTGEKVWTQADLEACVALCENDTSGQCVATQCAPGGQQFTECVQIELAACIDGPASPCRDEFATQLCCADARCDAGDPAFIECAEMSCADEIEALFVCAETPEVFNPCANRAFTVCVSDAPGDTPPDGASPAPSLRQGLEARRASFVSRLPTGISSALSRITVR